MRESKNVDGSDGNDTLIGGSGIDWLEGGEDDDTLIGGCGEYVLRLTGFDRARPLAHGLLAAIRIADALRGIALGGGNGMLDGEKSQSARDGGRRAADDWQWGRAA